MIGSCNTPSAETHARPSSKSPLLSSTSCVISFATVAPSAPSVEHALVVIDRLGFFLSPPLRCGWYVNGVVSQLSDERSSALRFGAGVSSVATPALLKHVSGCLSHGRELRNAAASSSTAAESTPTLT